METQQLKPQIRTRHSSIWLEGQRPPGSNGEGAGTR